MSDTGFTTAAPARQGLRLCLAVAKSGAVQRKSGAASECLKGWRSPMRQRGLASQNRKSVPRRALKVLSTRTRRQPSARAQAAIHQICLHLWAWQDTSFRYAAGQGHDHRFGHRSPYKAPPPPCFAPCALACRATSAISAQVTAFLERSLPPDGP
jgi:hypothetical protein